MNKTILNDTLSTHVFKLHVYMYRVVNNNILPVHADVIFYGCEIWAFKISQVGAAKHKAY